MAYLKSKYCLNLELLDLSYSSKLDIYDNDIAKLLISSGNQLPKL